jgi:hypothetical protein
MCHYNDLTMSNNKKISYESDYKLNITSDQKLLIAALKRLNDFFTNNRPDTCIQVEQYVDDDFKETVYHCYICNILCRDTNYIVVIGFEKNNDITGKDKYICVCNNSVCIDLFDILFRICEDVRRLSHIPLPLYTVNKFNNNMYLSIVGKRSVNFIFDKINGLVVFATTARLINNKIVPKNDDDHLVHFLNYGAKLDYGCDDFFPLCLRQYFSD